MLLFSLFQEVDAKVVRDVCNKYLYDKCPAIVGIGKWALNSN